MSKKTRVSRVWFAGLAVMLAVLATANSSYTAKGGQGAGKVSTRDFSFVVITGNDIRNLPDGNNRILIGTDGGIWRGVSIKNDDRAGVQLTKTGTGHLILPNANQYGVTKTGAGQLKNTGDSGVAKEGRGTLILTTTNDLVFEFQDLGVAEYSRVQIWNERLVLNGSGYLPANRPEGAMKGWPFKRLLIGSAPGIARTMRDLDRIADRINPSTNCQSGKFCQCSGTRDCFALASADACSSPMNCDGAGNGVKCYCKAK